MSPARGKGQACSVTGRSGHYGWCCGREDRKWQGKLRELVGSVARLMVWSTARALVSPSRGRKLGTRATRLSVGTRCTAKLTEAAAHARWFCVAWDPIDER